jgi:hypothetical protein
MATTRMATGSIDGPCNERSVILVNNFSCQQVANPVMMSKRTLMSHDRGVGFVNFRGVEAAVAAKAALHGMCVVVRPCASTPTAIGMHVALQASCHLGGMSHSGATGCTPATPSASPSVTFLHIEFQADRKTRRAAAAARFQL